MLKNKKCLLIFIIFCVFFVSFSATGKSVNGNFNPDVHPGITKHAKIESNLLDKGMEKLSKMEQSHDQYTKVIFKLNCNDISCIKSLQESGASIEAVHNDLVQASVPVSQLQAAAELLFVDYVRSPAIPIVDEVVISQGVGVINATPLINLGIKGKGVKIAVLDVGFAGYGSKRGTELPSNVNVRSFWNGGNIESGGNHGTAVAEIIYDIAPEAELYLINFGTDMEFLDAAEYAKNQKVDIISMSLGWLEGPFDGTSTISSRVNTIVSSGVIWINSAGNYAQKHWEGKFSDRDRDGIHNTINVPSEGTVELFLRWEDRNQDYELCMYEESNNGVFFCSTNMQDGIQEPAEELNEENIPAGAYNIKIEKFNANKDVTFQLYSAYQDLKYQKPSRSLSIPADASGAITVGATNYPNDLLEDFSSQGPTMDGRKKPDVVAPDRVRTSISSSFLGTSASSPHVAGAAALLKTINPSLTPDELRSALESTAKDLGDKGKDNLYGSGKIDVWNAAKLVDKKNPSISIVSPNDGKILNSSPLLVNGTAADNLGLDKVEVKVGNRAYQKASGTSTWSASVTLSPGQNTIYARATDTASNYQEIPIMVILDDELPAITISSPKGGEIVTTPAITITGTASDNLGLDEVEVKLGNGAYQKASGTSTWSASVILSPGQNMFYARATDSAGNYQETSISVKLDTERPSIIITSPAYGQKFNSSPITVSGKASDKDLSIVEVRVGNGDWQKTLGKNIWSISIPISPGQNTIYARATDSAGNYNETSISVTFDTEHPVVSITSPANDQIIATSSITVHGTASDNDGLSTVEVRVGNGGWQTARGTILWNASITLLKGSNTIYARATDSAGNYNEISINVTLDTTPPSIMINDDAEYTNSNGVTLNLSSTLGLMKFSNDNTNWTEWQPFTSRISWILTPGDGVKTVFFSVSDDAMNDPNKGAFDSIKLDTTHPAVSDLLVIPTIQELYHPVEIKAKISDNLHLNTSNLSVQIESQNGNTIKCPMVSNGNGIYSCYFENTSFYGRYDVKIIAFDFAGNMNNTMKTWFVTSMEPYNNISVRTQKNIVTEINASTKVNTTLEFVTSQNVNGNIKIILSNNIPPEINQSLNNIPFKKFISISTNSPIEYNLQWMNIKLFYTDNELRASSLDENSLRMITYDESLKMWRILSNTGVNTANSNNFSGFVWANVSHPGTFALVGSYPPLSNSSRSNSPSGGGGGGGGGGTSGEDFANIIVKEKYDLFIYKDILTSYKFTNVNNPIVAINIVGNVNAGEIATAVEVLRNTSSLVKTQAPGNVYKNVNVWVGTSGFGTSKKIKQGLITFRVENSWISENSIKPNGIKMVRWDGSKWDQVETSEKTKDSMYVYFEAKTNSFSSFAITETDNKESIPENADIIKSTTPTATIQPEEKTPDFLTNWFLIIGVLFAIGLIIEIYIMMKKK